MFFIWDFLVLVCLALNLQHFRQAHDHDAHFPTHLCNVPSKRNSCRKFNVVLSIWKHKILLTSTIFFTYNKVNNVSIVWKLRVHFAGMRCTVLQLSKYIISLTTFLDIALCNKKGNIISFTNNILLKQHTSTSSCHFTQKPLNWPSPIQSIYTTWFDLNKPHRYTIVWDSKT